MGDTPNPRSKEARRALHSAIATHTVDGGASHTIQLRSRCDCAWNAAHALARAVQPLGYGSVIQTWLGTWPLSVQTTEYSPFGSVAGVGQDLDEDELPF